MEQAALRVTGFECGSLAPNAYQTFKLITNFYRCNLHFDNVKITSYQQMHFY
jgi:hypothetical protein